MMKFIRLGSSKQAKEKEKEKEEITQNSPLVAPPENSLPVACKPVSRELQQSTTLREQMQWMTMRLRGSRSGGSPLLVPRIREKSQKKKPQTAAESCVIEALHVAPLGQHEMSVKCSATDSSFVFAVWTAYCRHYPLVLSPDDIWLVVAQGLGQHISANAEQLRHKFVTHSGKEKIIVNGDRWGIKVGNPDNNWPGVASDFSSELEKRMIGDCASILLTPFSTTGPTETMAMRVALMDAMSNYFTYECHITCGIPYVQLLGTVEDWEQVRDRAKTLSEYGLSWWTDHLVPLLDNFVRTARFIATHKHTPNMMSELDTTDRTEAVALGEFWNRICNRKGGGSGPTYISGWLNILFPYSMHGHSLQERFDACTNAIRELVSLSPQTKQPAVSESDDEMYFSLPVGHDILELRTELAHFPSGLSTASFILNDQFQEISMQFTAGFIGAVQDKHTMAIRPQIGWCAVRL